MLGSRSRDIDELAIVSLFSQNVHTSISKFKAKELRFSQDFLPTVYLFCDSIFSELLSAKETKVNIGVFVVLRKTGRSPSYTLNLKAGVCFYC